MKRTIFKCITIVICLMVQITYVKAEESKIVRVGYPIVGGFTEVEDGIYSGYAYEYLREIAKYTGWEYEFVEMSLNDAMNELRDGNIDIVGGMLKNEQSVELYDFPEFNSGSTYTTLSALKDNKKINGSDLQTLDGIKVGYFETSKVRLNDFIQFCKGNGIHHIELVPYPHESGKILLPELERGEVDAVIEGDLLINPKQQVVAKFGAIPYYFATTKGNTEIILGLNNALSKIKESNPSFDQVLYNKYFQSNNDRSLKLTQEEQDYISKMNTLKVSYVNNYKLLENYNPITKEPEGIIIAIMDLIAERTGFDFEFVLAENDEEAYEMIKNKEVDLIAGAPSDYMLSDKNDFILTPSYLKINMVTAVSKDQKNLEDELIVALPKGYSLAELDDKDIIRYYDTYEDCLKAVQKGEATYTYGNIYTLSNYLATGYYPNVTIITSDKTLEIAIGIAKKSDKNLQSILSKAIYSLSNEDLKDVFYNNIINGRYHITLKHFFFDNLELSLIVITIVLTIIIALIYSVVRMKFKVLNETKALLLEKSQKDSLTGLYNREACEELITSYLDTKASSQQGAFIIMDIDYFKEINDSFGHQMGDELLKEFSQLLKEVFDEQDIICRLGGDEFIVFMPDIEEDAFQTVDKKLKQLCQLMNKEITQNSCSQKISLSIGAIIIKQEVKFKELYHQADVVLYEVKLGGRNGFKIKDFLEIKDS